MSPFVSPLSTIARAHNPAVKLSGKAHGDSVHIVVIAVLKTVKARVSQKQVHTMQLFSSHCYAALHLFKEMKLQIRNLTSL